MDEDASARGVPRGSDGSVLVQVTGLPDSVASKTELEGKADVVDGVVPDVQLRTGLKRSVQIADYIDGTESASAQSAAAVVAYEAAADRRVELQWGPPRSGAPGYALTDSISVAAPTRSLGRGARIVQTSPLRGIFDQHETAEGAEFDDFELIGPTRVYPSGSPAWRADNPLMAQTAVYATAPGTRITNIRGGGWEALVYLTNYKHATSAKAGFVDGYYVDAIASYADNDFGVLAIGTEGAHIGAVSGSYSPTLEGTSPPPHLVYVSDNQPHKRMTGGGWRAKDGGGVGANHAFVVKGVTGGSLTDLVADNCPGLITFTADHHLTVSGLVATNDRAGIDTPGAAATIQHGTADSTFVTIVDADLSGQPDRFVALSGNDGQIGRLVIATARTTYISTQFELTVAGNRNRIRSLSYRNTGTDSRRLLNMQAGTDNKVHIDEAAGIRDLCTISAGATRAVVSNVSDSLAVGPNAGSQLVTTSEATARLRPTSHRLATSFTNGSNATFRQDPSRTTTHVLTKASGAGAVDIGAPYVATVDQECTWEVVNGTAGAITVTWNAVFVFAGAAPPAAPAAGKRIRVSFRYDGTSWVETSRGAEV